MKSRAPVAAALLVLALAGALRFEALVDRYWKLQGAPGWALAVRDAVSRLHPAAFAFRPDDRPYEGDPFAYLRYAREMRGFYDAHVREPLFVASARVGIALAGGGDIGLNLVSAAYGTLLVGATLLLGSRLAGSWAGVVAAGLLAIDRRVVGLSVEGWRDDAFAALAALCAWAILGLFRQPSRKRAILVGVLGAAAGLTRLTSLTFLFPAWALVAVVGNGARAARWRTAALAMCVTLLLMAPYLLACAVEFSDPLYAVNYHAADFSRRAGLSPGEPTGVGHFLMALQGPMERLDTLWLGLTSVPFSSKWAGFRTWSLGLGPVLALLSLFGLLRWAFQAEGRLLLVVMSGLLLPYALIWPIPGGNNWRYTLPVYPFYLIAASALLSGLTAEFTGTPSLRRSLAPTLKALGLGAACLLLANALAYARVAEDLRRGRSTLVSVGSRDGLLLTDGWSWPERQGNVLVRRAHQAGTLTLPLPAGDAVSVALRVYAEGPHGLVVIHLNDSRLETFEAPRGPRMVEHRLVIDPGLRGRRVRLQLEAAPGADLFFWYARLERASP
jgi:4-amino-4-deoxy-L-arabinose transferase-like glycosyltransferase